ncbi:DUF3006 domain-containing protein [Acetobacterium wieringae]|uniref:DUF3006 domain-containing protein n=1 Tax=Acetobacterium wieringae TaxID=52694 RepID=A0ABY6HED2_9FIRM|nr:DUF3006 domain-containing protein [Acetobacterium wieringae]UYO62830.1 DUF3006 domain-containing protein [Acetobacterium wieringae]
MLNIFDEKEDHTMIEIPRIVTPDDAKEGDVLIIENNEIIVDHEATKKKKRRNIRVGKRTLEIIFLSAMKGGKILLKPALNMYFFIVYLF